MEMTGRLEIDPAAWDAGFLAGVVADLNCPYPIGTRERMAWASGWIEGRKSAAGRPIASDDRAGE